MRRRLVITAVGAVALLATGAGAVLVLDDGNPTVVLAPTEADEAVADLVEAGSAASSFPLVRSVDLNGDEVSLPDDLPGSVTVVLLSWGRAHQDPVDEWIEGLEGIESASPDVDHVQLAVTGRSDVATRGAVQFFMRQAIPGEVTRARTIPLFTDHDQFAELVGVDSTSEAGVLLVHGGRIAWRFEGSYTAAAEELLMAEITALLA